MMRPTTMKKRKRPIKSLRRLILYVGIVLNYILDIEAGRVKSAYFHGYGCAISKASTSILVQRLEGMPLAEIPALCEQFFSYVLPEQAPEEPIDTDFQAFEAAKQFSGRLEMRHFELGRSSRLVEVVLSRLPIVILYLNNLRNNTQSDFLRRLGFYISANWCVNTCNFPFIIAGLL